MANSKKNNSFIIKLFKTFILLLVFLGIIALFYLFSNMVVKLTTKTNDYIEIANYLKGENRPVKNLILFSNSAEQRFGGGFIGSVGLVSANKSKFNLDPIHSVYYFDKELIGKPEVYPLPDELKGLTASLGLRDSAIYPNWPDSAKLAAKFYHTETGTQVDNVISVTPEFLKGMLKITGPITLNEYNKVITADNFLDSVQLEVESGSDKKSGKDPKTILSVLSDRLINRLLNEDIDKFSKYYDLLKKMIEEKQLVIYSFDSKTQERLEKANMSAKLAQTDGNYLLVAGANIGANKSSPFVEQKIDQNVTIDKDGVAIVDLKIIRKHNSDYKYFYYDTNLSENKWLIAENAQYQEVFVPFGSELISASNGKSNIRQFSQNGKTVYAFMQKTEPKKSSTIEISYRLPFKYVLSDNLIVKNIFEKQVGGYSDKITQSIRLPEKYHLSEAIPDKYNYVDGNILEYNDFLNSTIVTELKYVKK